MPDEAYNTMFMTKKNETTETVDETNEVSEETTEEEKPEPIEGEEETTEEVNEPSQTDENYDAIVEEEETRGKPDSDKAEEAFKKRKDKRGETTSEEDEEEPLTESRMRQILNEDKQERHGDYAKDVATEVASSEKEANAILAIWKNRSYPQGMSVRAQLLEAQGTVNFKRSQAENGELKRKINSKDTVSKDVASTHKDSVDADAPKIKPDDAQALKAAGFKWNGKKNVYRKGNFIFPT